MRPILNIREVALSYGDQNVVENLSFDINPGIFVGLLGANGAGKSTLLLAMSGQFQPEQGNIFFNGQDIYANNLSYKHEVGFVHETPFFYPGLSVIEFMQFVGNIKKVEKDHLNAQIKELLQEVKLTEETYTLSSRLSQGMRKKLAIATAFLGQPKIVFLDEALNGVDLESIFHIKRLFKRFVSSGGTIILATHILEVLEKLCGRFLILSDGRLVADLSHAEIQKMKTQNPSFDLESFVVKKLS